MFASYFEP